MRNERNERLSAAYEQVAEEVEKLVRLIYESQQNQQAFMTEAYRLLQAQSREVREIRERAYTTEHVVRLLEEVLNKLAAFSDMVKINITTPGGTSAGETPTGQTPQPPAPGQMGPSQMGSGQMGPGQPAPSQPSGGMGYGEQTPPEMVPAGESMFGAPAEAAELPGEAVPVPLAPPPVYPLEGEPEAVPVLKPVVGHAEVRFLHASPDAHGVDIYADGKKVVSNLTYESVSPYVRLDAGRHRLQVFPAGVTAGAVIDTVANLKSGVRYTVAAAGNLKEIRPVVVEHQTGGGKPGFARLKVVYLSPNGPAVDITLPTGKILLGHLTYKEKSPYLQVAPGVRDLEVRLAGKTETVLKVPKLRIEANTTYTLYILGPGKQLVPLLLTE